MPAFNAKPQHKGNRNAKSALANLKYVKPPQEHEFLLVLVKFLSSC